MDSAIIMEYKHKEKKIYRYRYGEKNNKIQYYKIKNKIFVKMDWALYCNIIINNNISRDVQTGCTGYKYINRDVQEGCANRLYRV